MNNLAEIKIDLEGIDSEDWEKRKKRDVHRAQHKRYDFIDQFRGLTVMFLAISWITWNLGTFEPSLVPPIFDPGSQFVDSERTSANRLELENQFYTIIDLGSSLFVFILGVTTPISFRSKQKKRKTTNVISFNLGQVAEIYVSDRYLKDTYELLYYILHGLLHTIGYDHTSEKEESLMEDKCQQYMGDG